MRNSFAKKLGMSLAAFGLVAASMFTVQDAEAVPAFARQTGMPCNACHFQQFPALNAMGRSFLSGGYTMEGTQASIEGENAMKLPDTLNMSAISKIRHVSTNETGDDVGEIQWPDEAALLVGGRASANAGFLWELGLDAEHEGGSPEFLSTKYHFLAANSGDIQFSVIPYATDGLGALYGYDTFNTASKRSQRPMENRKAMSAYQATGIGSGEATGIALVASSASWFVNYSAWGPVWGGGDADFSGLAALIRAGYFMDVAGLELGLGLTSMSGKVTTEADNAVENDTFDIGVGATGIDIQLQGDLAGMPVGLWVTNVTVPKSSSATDSNYYNSSTTDDMTSTAFAVKAMVMPELGAYYASSSVTTADTTTYGTIGIAYNIAQNIRLDVMQNTSKAGDADAVSEQMFSLFSGF
ncbi:MAG: hypothetical protein RRB13_14940 [bacterium]|nr:hypothetical protein [bacterium]